MSFKQRTIDLLKKVEDKLSKDLFDKTAGLATAASTKFYMTLFLALIILGMTVFVEVLFSRSIFEQVGDEPAHIQEIAGQIAKGNLDVDIKSGTGILASIGEMANTLNDAANQADVISSGDYTTDIKPRSDKDKLGIALQKMIEILRDAAHQADVISSGDYTADIKPRGDKDKLGIALQKMTAILRTTTAQNKKLLWTSEGLAGVHEAARGKTDIRTMASSVCKYLAKYFHAQILTIYRC